MPNRCDQALSHRPFLLRPLTIPATERAPALRAACERCMALPAPPHCRQVLPCSSVRKSLQTAHFSFMIRTLIIQLSGVEAIGGISRVQSSGDNCAQLTSLRRSALSQWPQHEQHKSLSEANVVHSLCHLWRESGRELRLSARSNPKNPASRSPPQSTNCSPRGEGTPQYL